MRKSMFLKNPIAFVLVIVLIFSLLIVLITMLRLPDVSLRNNEIGLSRQIRIDEKELGKFEEMMIDMLPQDLAFTIFVPSDEAFERDLKLQVNDSFVDEKVNDTYAIVSRILGFSAVPRALSSHSLRVSETVSYDSLSGLVLYISKDVDGMVVVNRIRSKKVNLRKGEIVVHVMDGVIMDAEFEQSVQPAYGEDG